MGVREILIRVRSVTSYGIIILKPSITLSHTIYIQCDFWTCKRYRFVYKKLSAPPPLFKSVCCVSGRLGVPAVVESSWVWICSYWILRYRKLQRFMIYVHAKGMIVDDEYVLMGSANTNQRSVAGIERYRNSNGQDTTWPGLPSYHHHHITISSKVKVYGYKMSLWAEHLGKTGDEFVDPADLECVNEIAEGILRAARSLD
ncbi:hypothetical protein Bca4012_050858 [Brassica carinata]